MTIDELYQFVQFAANKEQRGYVKPSEFNMLATRAQIDVIQDRYGKHTRGGQVANSKKRMIAEWLPKLYADDSVDSIPANEDDMIAMVVARSDYKDRAARDAKE